MPSNRAIRKQYPVVTADCGDDEPPILEEDECGATGAGTKRLVATNIGDAEADEDEETLMQEMVETARRAKDAKRKQQDKVRNSKSFGAGLRRGFFASSTPRTPATQRLEPTKTSAIKREEKLRVVQAATASPDTGDTSAANASPFVFPEVQDALKGMNQLDTSEWMTPRFFEKLAKHPKLLQALQNPRFMEAINEMQRDPEAAVRKYQKDKDLSVMLRDFMEFLGLHFEELGKAASEKQPPIQCETKREPLPDVPAGSAIVDLDQARHDAIAGMARSPEEEQQVQRVLRDPALMATLSDKAFMDKLHQCQQDPRRLEQLSREDPTFAPKLRQLVDARMISFA